MFFGFCAAPAGTRQWLETRNMFALRFGPAAAEEEIAWRFSQVKGSADDDVTEGKIFYFFVCW